MPYDLTHGFALRLATPADHEALCTVCLKTGNAGADATGTDQDGDLVGLYYAVPYQVLEPDFCFVIENNEGVCGYVMGTPDTKDFERRFNADWLPGLRRRTPPPSPNESTWSGFDWLRARIHSAEPLWLDALRHYPAQGHIDLLPQARGQGVGQAAMRHLMDQITRTGAGGIHLHVSPQNTGAQIFYHKLGYGVLQDPSLPTHTTYMVRTLP